jgi:hypothetical protein
MLLGVILVILEPNLVQIEQQNASGAFGLAPTYGVVILILMFVGVMAGALIAIGIIASGFKLPRRARVAADGADVGQTSDSRIERAVATQSRAARTAAAATAMEARAAPAGRRA